MDKRFDRVASSLGLSLIRRVLHVHLPLLAMPIGAALFIGFAVSIALYLPTVFISGGRIGTITVEAVSLAANGSRGPAGGSDTANSNSIDLLRDCLDFS